MKRMKNLLSLVLALVMVMAMTLTAMATEALPGEVKDPNENMNVYQGHTYTAFQIFAGVQSEESGPTLSNVTWGSAIYCEEEGYVYDYSNEVIAKLKTITVAPTGSVVFGDCKDARGVAEALEENASNSAFVLEVAKAFYGVLSEHTTEDGKKIAAKGTTLTIDETSNKVTNAGDLVGYYLIVDETNFAAGAENTVKNLALLQLTGAGDFEIKIKTDIPSVEKKVDDENDSEDAEGATEWQDTADYDLGDEVPFQLTATLPEDLDRYGEYTLIFHDVQSSGLTFSEGSVEVKVVEGEGSYTVTGGYVVNTTPNDGCTFEIKIDDVKKLTFEGALTDYKISKDAKIIVTYKSTLNGGAIIGNPGNDNKVHLEYSNNPNGEGTGKTPQDTVTVFTFQLVVNKVEKNSDESTAEANPFVPLTGAAFTLEKWVLKTGDDPATEEKEEETHSYYAWELVEVLGADEARSTFTFGHLDAGLYRLTESKTPAGYNTIDTIYFKIEATHTADPAAHTVDSLKFTQTNADGTDLDGAYAGDRVAFKVSVEDGSGSGSVDIVNQKGVTLPETGGIGTTIFTVSGIILVIIAGVLLVTKKRMSKEE